MKGKYAGVTRETPTLFEEGMMHMRRMIFYLARSYYFHQQIRDQLRQGNLEGVEEHQANACLWAFERAIILELSKLVEKRKDCWNLEQVVKVWEKTTKDYVAIDKVKQAVDHFRQDIGPLVDYRHNRGAHQHKDDDPRRLTVFVNLDEPIRRAVKIADMFVEGVIPYELATFDGVKIVDLREFLEV